MRIVNSSWPSSVRSTGGGGGGDGSGGVDAGLLSQFHFVGRGAAGGGGGGGDGSGGVDATCPSCILALHPAELPASNLSPQAQTVRKLANRLCIASVWKVFGYAGDKA